MRVVREPSGCTNVRDDADRSVLSSGPSLLGNLSPTDRGPDTPFGSLAAPLATANAPWNLNDQASIYEGGYYSRVDPCGRSIADPSQSARELARSDDVCLAEALDNLKEYPGHYARSRVSQLIHFPLSSFDFATGKSTTVARNLGDVGLGLTTSPDGRTILYSRVDSSVDDLMLVENFR